MGRRLRPSCQDWAAQVNGITGYRRVDEPKERTFVILQAQDGWDWRGGWALAGGARAGGLGRVRGFSPGWCPPGSLHLSACRPSHWGEQVCRLPGSAVSVQQGAAAVHGWGRPATAAPLCTRDT